jgi:drug/metabolite transporter (DMT)-like permease
VRVSFRLFDNDRMIAPKEPWMKAQVTGAMLATVTAVTWGGQFVVGKSALGHLDAFNLTTVRYAAAVVVLLAILAAVEGPRALRLDGRGLRLAWLGALGFAGFNLFVYTGLAHAPAQSAAFVGALGPLLTAIVLWLRTRVRPTRLTVGSLVVALVGVALVIGGGNPGAILTSGAGWGDALVLVGVLAFTVYRLGAADFAGVSPLRYTALTAALGWVTIAAATLVADAVGLESVPSAGALRDVAPQLAYITLLGAVVAVVAWNGAIAAFGPQNTALFSTLIPVTAFVIEIVRGYRPGPVELVGAALTLAALLGANLLGRRRRVAAPAVEPELAAAA